MDKKEQLIEEYKMLRAELLHFMDKDTTLITCLFSGVTAILFFALQRKMPEVCLLAYLIIIPVCSKLAYHQKQMAKISVYLSAYLEKELEIKWETYVKELSRQKSRPRRGKILKFSECIMMAIATLLSYIFLVVMKGKGTYEGNIIVFTIESFLMLFLFIMVIVMSLKIYKIKEYRMKYEMQIHNTSLGGRMDERNRTN